MSHGGTNRRFIATNPPSGAQITYHLKKAAKDVKIEVLGSDGAVLRSLEAKTGAGLHSVSWDLRGSPPANGNTSRGRFGRSRRGRRVELGTYTVRLSVDGMQQDQQLKVEIDPDHPDPSWITNQEEAERLEAELVDHGDEEERDR